MREDAARRRDRVLARLPLGRHAAAGPGHHLGRCLQRHRHHLSGRLPLPMQGEIIKAILEDVADNLFHPDPYYQQGGDMVRVGGMGFTINVERRWAAASAICACRDGGADRGRQGLRRVRLGLGERERGGAAGVGCRGGASSRRPRRGCHRSRQAVSVVACLRPDRLARLAGPAFVLRCTCTRVGQRRMLTQIYIHLGVALAGLVSFLSPCVLPLVPPYLGYLGGTTIEQMTGGKDGIDAAPWRRVVLASLCFVLGFTTVFVALGAGASVFGQWIQTYKAQLAIVAGLVIIMFRSAFPRLVAYSAALSRGAHPRQRWRAPALPAPMSWVSLSRSAGRPCIGPVLATVLTLAANEASLGCGRAPAVRLFARSRHSVHAGRGCHRSVPGLPAALPPASAARRDGDGRVAGGDRHVDPDGLAELVWHLAASRTCRCSARIEEWSRRSGCRPRF